MSGALVCQNLLSVTKVLYLIIGNRICRIAPFLKSQSVSYLFYRILSINIKMEKISSRDRKVEDVLIRNPQSRVVYKKGSFLGKGGFAKCYEFINTASGEVFAGKVVSKSLLLKPHHKEKMFQEIHIQKSLSHKYIVSLKSYFEDDKNVYIILELCRRRSLTEMHKRRKTLTIPEVRYFMQQIVLACKYMHDNKIIHRDLKLGNLFINDNMEIKVGDFGLATRVSYDGERKKTLCGTPNYIAPEILSKSGHSYEVDIWSLGCIMYTLLVGRPPFETDTLTDTYSKIKKNEYLLPSDLDVTAKKLIKRLLHPDPSLRPNADQILDNDFLMVGYIPSCLPTSLLTMEPRASRISLCVNKNISRKPLTEKAQSQDIPAPSNVIEKAGVERPLVTPKDFYIKDLLRLVDTVVRAHPENIFTGQPEDSQSPDLVPFVWISKWVDYSDKYGVGYQLCDNSIGVFYNDSTHLVLRADEETFEYINGENTIFGTLENFPPEINKKITILKYFRSYMNEHLLKAGECAKPQELNDFTQLPYLRSHFKTKSAIVFHLTNGTVQINFFKDHTKIVLCPIMEAVSFMDEDKNFTVYSLKLIAEYGCPPLLASRLKYARGVIERLFFMYQSESAPTK